MNCSRALHGKREDSEETELGRLKRGEYNCFYFSVNGMQAHPIEEAA